MAGVMAGNDTAKSIEDEATEFAELRERIAKSLAQAKAGHFAEGTAREAINRAFDAARKVRS